MKVSAVMLPIGQTEDKLDRLRVVKVEKTQELSHSLVAVAHARGGQEPRDASDLSWLLGVPAAGFVFVYVHYHAFVHSCVRPPFSSCSQSHLASICIMNQQEGGEGTRQEAHATCAVARATAVTESSFGLDQVDRVNVSSVPSPPFPPTTATQQQTRHATSNKYAGCPRSPNSFPLRAVCSILPSLRRPPTYCAAAPVRSPSPCPCGSDDTSRRRSGPALAQTRPRAPRSSRRARKTQCSCSRRAWPRARRR